MSGSPLKQPTPILAEIERAHAEDRTRDIASAISTVACEARGLRALCDALAGDLGASFSDAVRALANAEGRVIVTGVGKSGHIARKISATLASTGKAAQFVHPSDASHGDLGMIRAEDAVLAISWSGETAELSDIVAYTRRFGVPLIGSTSSADSTLARAADIALVLPQCSEACQDSLAPTTSTTMQLALGDALAMALLGRRGFSADDFHNLHPGGRLGARLLRVRAVMHHAHEVPIVSEAATLSEAIVRMTRGRFGIVGVIDTDGRLTGVITDGDLRRAFAKCFVDQPVIEVMSRNPRITHPDDLAHKALARMNLEKITGLFVIEEDKIVGLLHVHDLLRAGLM